MFLRIAQRQPLAVLRASALRRMALNQRRSLIPAPKPNSGPLMERRADRELPDIPRSFWPKTLPVFVLIMALSSLAVFNYQKSSSSVVASTMYALRQSDKARDVLGDEIYFKQSIPWISGELNPLHGRIDISFPVKGTKGWGTLRFRSFRPAADGLFETVEWSIETEDGRKIDLLDDTSAFQSIVLTEEDIDEIKEEQRTRGFRKAANR